MARKKRTIAGFDDVANRNINDSDDDKININNNTNVNDNLSDKENDNIDPLDQVLKENKKKDKTHILKGIYFEKEVAAAIDRLGRQGGRGIKSQIVNEAVKKVFKEKGWME
ncbi:hypothetical protein JOC94_004215 [Bacillus thermophilus]|uniref:Uncharacterized protein n=1 Tax=Siminovitchia thermophila TaxID=1245522 RepID=A0ABS2RC04_9BACI|nr:hypothetical protein [Siminovitchia thermophila]MBM7717190.1 hypothetical protein [Siminovitchia thermophila]